MLNFKADGESSGGERERGGIAMFNQLMDMINSLGFQLIPGFWALFAFLLISLFPPAGLKEQGTKRDDI